MNIFITGSESYIGKNLLKIIDKKKFNIYTCDIKPIQKKNYLKLDISSKTFIKKFPKNIDLIIHLAAISNDQECKKNKKKCFKTNISGTRNILKVIKLNKIKKLIFASTEWVYHDELAKKSTIENPNLNLKKLKSLYAKSKLKSEFDIKKFYLRNKIDISILRFGIIYGNRIKKGSAVESIFDQIMYKKILKIGSLNTARKYIHINDICESILKSISLNGFNIFNIQGNELVTLKKLIIFCQKIINKKIQIIETNPKNPSIRNISNEITNKKLRFKPKFKIYEGLRNIKMFYDRKKI